MKQLSIDEQRKMVQMGVTCSSTQLLRTGIVHADPHEGNMLFTDDGRLAMLDFGLMCRVENDKQVRPRGRFVWKGPTDGCQQLACADHTGGDGCVHFEHPQR
jgi:tRNA A-37 threonylcarbamoyl transferase component Bud32